MASFTSEYIETHALTDVGCVRKNNEDAIFSSPAEGCFVISDGMGGGKAGEVASAMMVNETEKALHALKGPATPGEREGALIRAAYRVNFAIKDYATQHHFDTMGATIVAIVLNPWQPGMASIFHAGDSRAYRIRNEQIEQLMCDHSVAGTSKIPESQLAPIYRGVLTNALGAGNDFFLERTAVDIQEDDILFLCSDGLTRMVRNEELLHLYRAIQNESVKSIAETFIKVALQRGGRDNVSLILIRVKKIGSSYVPTNEEAARESDAQVRNVMELSDTPPTEVVVDMSALK